MPTLLLFFAVAILICIAGTRLANRFGVPALLVFMALGMLFGSDGIFRIPFDNYQIAEQVCSIALIFIMFYGGFGTSWKTAKPIVVKAGLLASLGTVLTAGITGLFCHFVLRFDWLESFLIGSVISSTDAASVFSILRSKRLNLKNNTAALLEVESGSNDPFSYMLTVLILSMMSHPMGPLELIYMLLAQVVVGVVVGVVLAFAATWALNRFPFATAGIDAIFVLAIAVLSYAIPTLIGGNGYLSAYIAGIIIGNRPIANKVSLVHFFDGMTGLMQMLIFFLLGLLAFPSQLPQILLPSVAIALFLTFVSRPVAVFSILSPARCPIRQQLVTAWAGLRGAASIVFAIMAMISEAYMKTDVFHIVFCVVLLSISFQGTLLPLVARKLKMVDSSSDVLKTFTDYDEENEIQFIKLSIHEDHMWIGKPIREVTLPPDTLIVVILRGEETVIPGERRLSKRGILRYSAPRPSRMKSSFRSKRSRSRRITNGRVCV